MDGVQRWLDRLGLGQLAAVFADQQIDLDVLTELTDEDLVQAFGIRTRSVDAILPAS